MIEASAKLFNLRNVTSLRLGPASARTVPGADPAARPPSSPLGRTYRSPLRQGFISARG